MKSKVNIELGKRFQKEFKRLLKKYPSLKEELTKLRDTLGATPTAGIALGNDTYKIRLAIKSKGKGKSGGARVISYVETEIVGLVENNSVSILTIYDKSEISSISKEDIQNLLKNM